MPIFEEISEFVNTIPGTGSRPDYAKRLFEIGKLLPNPALVVEIGAFVGGSSICFAHALRGTRGHIISIDARFVAHSEGDGLEARYASNEIATTVVNTTQDYVFSFLKNIQLAKVEGYVSLVPGFSEDVYQRWDKRPIDLIYIDGAHTYEAVKKDCQWLDEVVAGGYAAFDDWIRPVEQAANEYFASHGGWTKVDEPFPRLFKKG